MSTLADLLAGDVEPHVFRWVPPATAAPDDVRRLVDEAGWRFAHVDGAGAPTKPALLAALGEALDFPAHYGANFDALADCLHDVDAGDRAGTLLLWDDWGRLATAQPSAFAVALTVLGVRADAKRGGPFAVLLRGAGPAPAGVPLLG